MRFYKRQADLSTTGTGGKELRGDASETFAFASFWPDAIQPPIAAIADGLYNALVAIRVCTPFTAEDVELGNEQATARGEGGLPNVLDHGAGKAGRNKQEDAERRRALALKALDQRLHAASTNNKQQSSSPSSVVPSATVEPATSTIEIPAGTQS